MDNKNNKSATSSGTRKKLSGKINSSTKVLNYREPERVDHEGDLHPEVD